MRHPEPPEENPRITMAEVAARAGVSTATVSRTLARPDAVTPARAARVRTAIAELGYAPNAAGRALASRESGLVGVLVSHPLPPWQATLLVMLERALANRQRGMLVAATAGAADTGEASERLLRRGVDGVIVVGEAGRGRPASGGLPPVVRCCGVSGEGEAAEGADLAAADVTLAAVLAGLGHRRVALVAGPGDFDGGARRFPVLRAALAAAGCELGATIGIGAPDTPALADALVAWCGEAAPVTAVVCTSDDCAVAVLQAAMAQGIAVPGRLSVVGFGDDPVGRLMRPRLTTIRLPAAAMAAAAVERLLTMRTGIDAAGAAVPARVVMRETLRRTP
jgi:DNA-binding LacI/PurR family transcriptional regulator